MKQFEILSGRCLVVELPEGAHSPLIECINVLCDLTYIDEWGYDYCSSFRLPPGAWEIVGMLGEVTEEQAAGVVDEPYESGIEQYTEPDDVTGWIVSEAPMGTKYSKVMYKGYRDYTKDPDGYSAREINPFGTAIESLESAILAEGYLLESPPTPKCGCFGPAEEGACPACDEWVESQSRVLDRERCLLLGREDT